MAWPGEAALVGEAPLGVSAEEYTLLLHINTTT